MPDPKILCLGDLHLGKLPSRLPAGVDPRRASVARVWERAVDLALREEVGLVLLAGDVVHRANRFFEAFGPLEEGLGRLADAGVDVCAVAGNHDFDVLPRLAGTVSGRRFHLLGQGGRWERFTWRDRDGGALLHVDGWSFPARDVRVDPVAEYDLESPGDEAPVLGLVHGDLEQVGSTNAPLGRPNLEAKGGGRIAAWLLGHVHKPGPVELSRGRWALYPGSPQPLDPTETGVHGGWLVTLAEGRLGPPEPAPLATIRWERLEVDLSHVRDSGGARGAVVEAARTAAETLAASGPGAPAWLLFRADLVGRTRVHGELVEVVAELGRESSLELAAGDARARVVEVADRTRPPVDLADLARGEGAPAVLAGLLLALEAAGDGTEASEGGEGALFRGPLGPAERALLGEIEEAVRRVSSFRPFADLPAGPGTPASARARLAGAAWSLLDALVAQKPATSPGAPRA